MFLALTRAAHRVAAPTRGPAVALAALAALLALSGCASTPRAEGEEEPRPRERTTVRVENRAFLDMNVFVLRSSQRIRLGMVTGNSTQTFTIPPNLVFGIATLQFLVDPIGGGRAPISNEIRVVEGEEVRLMIPPM